MSSGTLHGCDYSRCFFFNGNIAFCTHFTFFCIHLSNSLLFSLLSLYFSQVKCGVTFIHGKCHDTLCRLTFHTECCMHAKEVLSTVTESCVNNGTIWHWTIAHNVRISCCIGFSETSRYEGRNFKTISLWSRDYGSFSIQKALHEHWSAAHSTGKDRALRATCRCSEIRSRQYA